MFRFETTDKYPLDSNKYSVSCFDPLLMEKHNAWKAAGGTELNWDTLNDHDINFTTLVNATQPLQSEVTNSPKEKLNISLNVTVSASLPTTSTPSLPQEDQVSFTENANDEYVLKKHLGKFPYQAPSGYKWVTNGWKLFELNATEKPWIKSFGEVFPDKIKGPLSKNKGEVKQCRLDCHSNLVSQKEFLDQLQIKEAESKTSKNESCKKPNKKGLLTSAEKENSSESEIEEESVESSEEEDEDSDESIEERKEHEIPRIDIKQPELYLFYMWDSLPPIILSVRYNLWCRKNSTFVYSKVWSTLLTR